MRHTGKVPTNVDNTAVGGHSNRIVMPSHSAFRMPVDGASVLIVDDEPTDVLLLERHLRALGIKRIHTVTDARFAVDACLKLAPDLVVLDLHMPRVDGFEVLHQLRRRLPSSDFVPVLVLTSDVTPASRERALDAGANDFMRKPFDPIEVIQRVRNLLEMQARYAGMRHHNRNLRAELDRQLERQRSLEAELAAARDRVEQVLAGAVRMVYQPIVDLATGATIGVEALARFDHGSVRPPDVWFAEAATVGLRHELELAAVDAALADLDQLPDGWLLSLNAAPEVVVTSAFTERLADVDGERIIVELTEGTAVADYTVLLESIEGVRRTGARIAVDDVGAGYAGLQQIVRLRPDIVKIDRDITAGIDGDPVRRAMAVSLVSFGRETGCLIAAEGIERTAELETLGSLDVTWGQGYLLGRPAPLAARPQLA